MPQKLSLRALFAPCSMVFTPNDSPLAGCTGIHLTGTKIGERLSQEADTSVSLRVHSVGGGGEAFEVQARGELQLGLLIGSFQPNLQMLQPSDATSQSAEAAQEIQDLPAWQNAHQRLPLFSPRQTSKSSAEHLCTDSCGLEVLRCQPQLPARKQSGASYAENMRREKYEFSVSPPVVVYRSQGGQRLEPVEEVHCEVQDEDSGAIIEALTLRRGELLEMVPLHVMLYTNSCCNEAPVEQRLKSGSRR